MLKALNTHAVSISGVLTGVLGLLGNTAFQQYLGDQFGPQSAGTVSTFVTFAGMMLAYFGKPHTIAGK